MPVETTQATVYIVRCDYPNCDEEGPWGEEPANAIHDALEYFYWIERDDKFYCPDHQEYKLK